MGGARVFRIATRDATDLAGKLAVSCPRTAIDWPELRVDAVVSDPDTPNRAMVVGRWPAHPEPRALLVLEFADAKPARIRDARPLARRPGFDLSDRAGRRDRAALPAPERRDTRGEGPLRGDAGAVGLKARTVRRSASKTRHRAHASR